MSFQGKVAALWVAGLVRWCLAAPDTYNVGIQLFRDDQCFEQSEKLTLMEGVCYSNLYSNKSKAFSVKIVDFDKPGVVNIYQYSDNCINQMAFSPMRVSAGQCPQRFLADNFWGDYSLMFRGTPCDTKPCSTLRIITQDFFQSASCRGLTTASFSYPVNRECLRFENGTQTFSINEDLTNITQSDFHGSSMCGGPYKKTYYVSVDRCYQLYGDFAFKWRVDTMDEPAVAGASAMLPMGMGAMLPMGMGAMLPTSMGAFPTGAALSALYAGAQSTCS